MTHGVRVSQCNDEKNKILFSIWDFAGHTEYHTCFSYFFAPGSVYLLLFDCSVDLEKLESENSLLYWFYFLQTILGNKSTVLLVGTRLDVVENYIKAKKYSSKERVPVLRQMLMEVNNKLSRMLKEYHIDLKLHEFSVNGDNLLFLPVKLRSLGHSQVETLYNLVCTTYDSVEYSVSTTLRHKIVFEEIESLCIKSDEAQTFLNVSSLEKTLKKIGEEEEPQALQALKDLREILSDLHKLGVLVYFADEDLSDTIIWDVQWLARVYKAVLDHGKKKVEIFVENILQKLRANKLRTESKTMCKEFLSKLSTKTKLSVAEIWVNEEERKKSIVDKISFESVSNTLQEIQAQLVKEGNDSLILPEALPVFHVISEDSLQSIVVEILGEKFRFHAQKRNYLSGILSKLDLIVPKSLKKVDSLSKAYIVPLLFPKERPIRMKVSKEGMEETMLFNYKMAFISSEVWKKICVKLRNACLKVEQGLEARMEIFWREGFVMEIENGGDLVAVIEMDEEGHLVQNYKRIMRVKVSCKKDPKRFFDAIDNSVNKFVRRFFPYATPIDMELLGIEKVQN